MEQQVFAVISKIIRKLPSFIRMPIRFVANLIRVIIWWLTGQKIPPPYAYKIFTLIYYAKRYKTSIFVETGTYMGDTIDSLRNVFKKLYSVEIDDKLFKNAIDYFSGFNNVRILQGDSARVLPVILEKMNRRPLFWLDAHYAGVGTGRGEQDTPIMRELATISSHINMKPVILIDDARLFTGKNSYPKLNWLVSYISKKWKSYTVSVKNDVIRLLPKE